MDSDLEEMWKKLRFSREEEGELVIKSNEVAYSQHKAKFNLLVKLRINKDYNREAFKATLRQLWRCQHGVSIKEVMVNLYLAIFTEECDMKEIIAKGPWSFDKRRILFKRFHGDISPSGVKF